MKVTRRVIFEEETNTLIIPPEEYGYVYHTKDREAALESHVNRWVDPAEVENTPITKDDMEYDPNPYKNVKIIPTPERYTETGYSFMYAVDDHMDGFNANNAAFNTNVYGVVGTIAGWCAVIVTLWAVACLFFEWARILAKIVFLPLITM